MNAKKAKELRRQERENGASSKNTHLTMFKELVEMMRAYRDNCEKDGRYDEWDRAMDDFHVAITEAEGMTSFAPNVVSLSQFGMFPVDVMRQALRAVPDLIDPNRVLRTANQVLDDFRVACDDAPLEDLFITRNRLKEMDAALRNGADPNAQVRTLSGWAIVSDWMAGARAYLAERDNLEKAAA